MSSSKGKLLLGGNIVICLRVILLYICFYFIDCIEAKERKARYSRYSGNLHGIITRWLYREDSVRSETISYNKDKMLELVY